jgi:hypothetical protein
MFKTALEIAMENGKADVVEYLEGRFGGKVWDGRSCKAVSEASRLASK